MLFPLEPKLCRTLCSVGMVHVEVFTGLLVMGPIVLVLRCTFPRTTEAAEHRGMGLGVRSLGCQGWHCSVY